MSTRLKGEALASSDSQQKATEENTFLIGAVLMALAIIVVAVPTYYDLAQQIWSTEEQSHGPVVLGVALWLMWVKRKAFLALPPTPAVWPGAAVLAIGVLLFVIGRSQAIIQAEALSHVLFISTALLWLRGGAGWRMAWFPLFFLLFTVPLPGVLVQAVTLPLKSSVSYVAEALLHHLGYPIARSGVILMVGQYQLLVADACAGLTSMFTLEAFGLLYIQVMGYTNKVRATLLAILVIPCAFVANVVRVIILVLVTYYFGNEAGQGFVHQFAGLVLFVVAFMLLIGCDWILGRWFDNDRVPLKART
ncbi:MAG: exosortase B [Rubrivivax sp.]|nr:exosortase B [Rubrivivax sp.]